MKRSSIHRATRKSLAEHQAKFSLDGLKFHFQKLSQYTNPTGGGLDKIPLNTKNYTATYYNQFKNYPAPSFVEEPAPWLEPQPPKHFFLRKKAQYQVADHLLGVGQVAYWTGSTGKTTLLGLDIDDHESDPEHVQANAQPALHLFVEMTGLQPVSCKSPGGINAFLICHKTPLTTEFTNESWHAIVREVDSEARRRGLVAKLECKGKARIFNEKKQYCGVLFKDPLYASNPTDDQLHAFWKELESKPVTGVQLHSLLTTLANSAETISSNDTALKSSVASDQLIPTFQGNWAKQCREWAIHGLPCHDSIFAVTSELAKWLFFVELPDTEDRVQQVAGLLFDFCKLKHNGYVTRFNRGQEEDVKAQIHRIVKSTVSRTSANGKAILAKLQSQQHMKLVPLMQTLPPSAPFLPVKSTECCTVSNWLPAPEYRRQRAEQWKYHPDDTPLPQAIKDTMSNYYQRSGLKIKKPTLVKLQRFLNHLWASSGHEARLGVDSLRQKMGFGNDARRHIQHLQAMGLVDTEGYCPAAGVSKLYKLRERAVKMFAEDGR